MITVPSDVYEHVNRELGHIVDGKVVIDNTNVPAVRSQLTSILRQNGCNVPVDLLFKVVPVGDSVIIQMVI